MSAVLEAPALAIRPMRESDVSAVVRIERAAYAFPWSEGIFRDCLRVGYCCWVLERRAEVSGYGIMQIAAGESHILNLCVHPGVQGAGLGRSMLSHLLDVAREHDAQSALLEVRPTNLVARRLYAAVGFHEVGVRRDYYPGRAGKEDALILAIELALP